MCGSHLRWTGCSMCAICPTRSLQRRCKFSFSLSVLFINSWRYDIFGKYGAIRQIRVGNTPETRGTAFVIYEDIFDAKNACDHLSGFNVCNRYAMVKFECNSCAQVSGGPVLPSKQGFREAGRSEEGGRPAEDEGEIQPEHSCPLTDPPWSHMMYLVSYTFCPLNRFFGGWFVCQNCTLKNKWHFLQILSMDGGESLARLTRQVGQSVDI